MDLYNELSRFDLYHGNYTRLQTNYQYKYSLPFERVSDPEAVTLIFQNYWSHSVVISLLYYLGIRLIQRLMADRKPFSLKTPLFLWNGALAIFSILGFIRLSEDVIYTARNLGWYENLCYSFHPNDVAAYWSLLFAISKVVELGDTLFIVLRKKPLIFLHYYHHAAVLIYTFHSGAEHTAAGKMFMSMNYLAHSFMYSYYAATAAGLRLPRKVAMAVTSIQTTQMLAGVAISAMVYAIKTRTDWPCQQSMGNLYLAFIIYFTFAVLFIEFFYSAYVTNKKKEKAKRA